ncbi:CDP-alcohol phosphatidyltransferase family protein [Homoserinibacter sp. YIM 151385]|uniref:CDP-alcohol phosphatidyltransferase family protein n=1 Tax=Homoserinibacter sp. YIM 151385 TaxID=2985506 RepID=UPI0022F0D0D2|nr:CDP-alcohol phosphatidyltransferase family protein [Homoserinibacter sp. YIM 151385]WBU38830.1 CDP-alcohol phosphatidyltransferase family protein [Homoserinibacter sp. YIM 151385]
MAIDTARHAGASPSRLTRREASARLRAHQKPGYGVPAYLRWVNRALGRELAAAAAVARLTPSAVTVLSGLASAAGLAVILVAPHEWLWSTIAAALLLLGYALDSADGQLARLTGASSVAGEWLDHVVDAIRLPAVHLALAAALLREGEPLWVSGLALAFAALASGWFFAQTLAEKLGAPAPASPQHAPWWVSVVKLPLDTAFLYLLVPLLAVPVLFTAGYAGLFLLTLAAAAASVRRKYRALAAA